MRWTRESVLRIKDLSTSLTVEELSRVFNVTESSIKHVCYKYSIKPVPHKRKSVSVVKPKGKPRGRYK